MIAPDSAERVAEFVAAYDPPFAVLGDDAGEVIRAYGLSNPNIVGAPHIGSADVPFPGHLLIAPGGIVIDKAFTGDLRHRASATLLVSRNVADTAGPTATIDDEPCSFAVTLSTERVFGGLDFGARIDVTPARDWHLYAPGSPERYQALHIDIDGELLDEVDLQYPPAEPVHLAGLDDTSLVYSEPITIDARLRIRWRPELFWKSEHGLEPLRGLEGLVAIRPEPGPYPIRFTISYQACTDDRCLPPTSIEVELPLELNDDVPAAGVITPRV